MTVTNTPTPLSGQFSSGEIGDVLAAAIAALPGGQVALDAAVAAAVQAQQQNTPTTGA